MKHGLVGVSSPAFPVCGVGTEHVIVGQEVLVSEVLCDLSVVSDGFRVGAYLGLRKGHPYLHTQTPFTISSRLPPSKVPTLDTNMSFLKGMVYCPYQQNLGGPKSAS